ncbi:MAG: hypothetical protein ACETWK_13070 [Candidatus Aminicenantaceae bacterium]
MDKKDIKRENSIKVDYDNIDVADIMDQIKRKVERKQEKPSKEESLEEFPLVPPSNFQKDSGIEDAEGTGKKKRIKMILLKFMKPFAPFIKLLVLPVHEEIMETAQNLHKTNMRLDSLSYEFRRTMEHFKEYTKLLHSLYHNLVVELTKLKIEEESLRNKTRIIEKDFESLGRREKALEKLILK